MLLTSTHGSVILLDEANALWFMILQGGKAMDLFEAIQKRRSVRSLVKTDVPMADLEKIS